jgi:hypothetical protein
MASSEMDREQELAELLKEVRALRAAIDELKADPTAQRRLPPDYEVLVRAPAALPPNYAVAAFHALPPTYEVAAFHALPPEYAVLARARLPHFPLDVGRTYEVAVRAPMPPFEEPAPEQ